MVKKHEVIARAGWIFYFTCFFLPQKANLFKLKLFVGNGKVLTDFPAYDNKKVASLLQPFSLFFFFPLIKKMIRGLGFFYIEITFHFLI